MANFDEFKKVAAETAEAIADKSVELAKLAADKTRALARITKLYAEIAGEKDKQRRIYQQIGKAYCELHSADAEEGLSDYVDEILASAAAIELKKQEIDNIKSAQCDVQVDTEIVVDADFEEVAEEETPAPEVPAEEAPAEEEAPQE